MTAMERDELRDLLVRIDERVKLVQEAIRTINSARHCSAHDTKIKNLERMVWGCMVGLAGLFGQLIIEALK